MFVAGDLTTGYSLECLDQTIDYYYLDIDALTSSVELKEDLLNPFMLNTGDLPDGFMDYWAAKGVVESASVGWEEIMWDIINGQEPMFYILKTGSDFQLIDGLIWSKTGELLFSYYTREGGRNYENSSGRRGVFRRKKADVSAF